MKKQDNESLIQELTKRLDWYMMEASDEEFDAEEVQTLMKLLDSLKTDQEDNIDDELPVEEALDDFWKYYAKREEEEKILAADREEEKSTEQAEKIEEPEEKTQKVLRFFHRHRAVVVAAVIAVAIILGGSWQAVANAEKHGGFFWWMDKNEEGMTMITSPEEIDNFETNIAVDYDKMEDVPEEYQKYAEVPLTLPSMKEYNLDAIKMIKYDNINTLYVYLRNCSNEVIHFEIVIYPNEILRIRDGYPEYDFVEEFQENGINYEVFKKDEENKKQNYVVYFYYEKVKYAVAGMADENFVKELATECGEVVAKSNM